MYKNTLTKIIRIEKKKYYHKQLERYRCDIKSTWNVLKQAMNVSNEKSGISKIRYNDEIIDNSVDIANIFNTYFTTIGENIAQEIPDTNKHFSNFFKSV